VLATPLLISPILYFIEMSTVHSNPESRKVGRGEGEEEENTPHPAKLHKNGVNPQLASKTADSAPT
jgi:hypothetical protein